MPWFGRLLVVAGLLVCGIVVVGVAVSVNQATNRRRQATDPVPDEAPLKFAALTDAEIRRCADCHPAAAGSFFETPHANTLASVQSEAMLSRFLGPDGEGTAVDDTLPGFRYRQEENVLIAETDASPRSVRVEWVFGSGRHSQTPVAWTQVPGGALEGMEMHLSWYPDVGLSRTFDHADKVGKGLAALGIYESAETLTARFDCHTTGLQSVPGGFDPGSFETGVRCDKCHPNARPHLESAGEATMAAWNDLSPLAPSEKCGDCHRTASSPSVQKYAPEDLKLSRFLDIRVYLFYPRFPRSSPAQVLRTLRSPHRQ